MDNRFPQYTDADTGASVEEIEELIQTVLRDDHEDSAASEEIRELVMEATDAILDEIREGKGDDEELTDEENEELSRKFNDLVVTIVNIQQESAKPEEAMINFLQDTIGEARRNRLRKMEPEKRMRTCADRAAKNSRLYGNDTGEFFAALAAGARRKEPERNALGKKIMRERNANYHGD